MEDINFLIEHCDNDFEKVEEVDALVSGLM